MKHRAGTSVTTRASSRCSSLCLAVNKMDTGDGQALEDLVAAAEISELSDSSDIASAALYVNMHKALHDLGERMNITNGDLEIIVDTGKEDALYWLSTIKYVDDEERLEEDASHILC